MSTSLKRKRRKERMPIPEEDDVGDISKFEKPPVNVARYIDDVNPKYGEEIAEYLRPWVVQLAQKDGKAIIASIVKLGRQVSNVTGDAIMDKVRKALVSQLPADVDKSDLEEYLREEGAGGVGEFFDNDFYEAATDCFYLYIGALMQYIKGLQMALAEGLDYGFPAPLSDHIREAGNYPDPPEGSIPRY
jgi:hypothetical protein